MKHCELERVIREKGNPKLKRTGEKLVSFIEGVSDDMEGAIIELKKKRGIWVVDKVSDQEVLIHKLKRNWAVTAL